MHRLRVRVRANTHIHKQILSILIGVACSEGLIDINETVTHYLPQLKDTAYKNVRVKDVLQMCR